MNKVVVLIYAYLQVGQYYYMYTRFLWWLLDVVTSVKNSYTYEQSSQEFYSVSGLRLAPPNSEFRDD